MRGGWQCDKAGQGVDLPGEAGTVPDCGGIQGDVRGGEGASGSRAPGGLGRLDTGNGRRGARGVGKGGAGTGEVEDEADLIHELIHGWDSIIQLDDGTIINLSQFKQAYVKNEKGDVKTSKDPIFMRIVH